jgi:hypothetical protein
MIKSPLSTLHVHASPVRAACLGLLFLLSCEGVEHHAIGSSAPAPDARELVARAAAGAASWDVVGPHVLWAPTLCMAPPPRSAHVSRAPEGGHQGHKLFVLRANDPESYMKLTGSGDERSPNDTPSEAPLGLTLVKESYAPIAIDPADVPAPRIGIDLYAEPDGFYPYARRSGQTYRTGERRDAFVMVRVAPGTPDSEQGWVFGTVTPEGEVTSAGRVASCIGCHSEAYGEAGTDGLFGVKYH